MQVSAALVLQSAWRGRAVRLFLVACHRAAVKIQAAWRGYQLKTEGNKERTMAATIIQVLTKIGMHASYQNFVCMYFIRLEQFYLHNAKKFFARIML